jgi:hypothetical protein
MRERNEDRERESETEIERETQREKKRERKRATSQNGPLLLLRRKANPQYIKDRKTFPFGGAIVVCEREREIERGSEGEREKESEKRERESSKLLLGPVAAMLFQNVCLPLNPFLTTTHPLLATHFQDGSIFSVWYFSPLLIRFGQRFLRQAKQTQLPRGTRIGKRSSLLLLLFQSFELALPPAAKLV